MSPNLEWAPIKEAKCQRKRPAGRSGHTVTAMGPNVYMFGGLLEGASPAGPTDEMWLLTMSSTDAEWHICEKKVGVSASRQVGSSSRPSSTGGVDTPAANVHAWPCARWRHTATYIQENRILVIGGFLSSSERLNDVWVYSVVSRQWEDKTPPSGQRATVFLPRGGHSACCIGSRLWVYGGYGGALYSRKDLDDVCVLNLETWNWVKVSPKGRGPGRRSEHSAVAVDGTMFVIGGRSTTTEFKDMFVLDTEVDPPVWTEVEQGVMDVPRWLHATYAVQSVPHWKIFVFGGIGGEITESNRQGTFMNDVSIFDTGTERWLRPDIQGDPPLPRGDTQLEYYHQGGKLLLYGGWANRWFSDGFTLDVGSIVGPPYAVMDLTPNNGPITGETLLNIHGIDFINTEDVVIRFSQRKLFVDVQGTFVSQTSLTCLTPNFTETGIPPGTVDVRVCLAGESFTTTKADFTFFPVTDANCSFMYGPGLLEEGVPGRETTFVIRARDGSNNDRDFGGDEFEVNVYFVMGDEYAEDNETGTNDQDFDTTTTATEDEAQRSRITVRRNEDCKDGTYVVSWVPPAPGDYEISVNFKGTFGGVAGPVRGSPVTARFQKGQPAENNTMSGPAMIKKTTADVATLLQFATKAKEGIKRKIVKGGDESEVFDAVVLVQRQLIHFHERKASMQLLMDRSFAVLAQMRKEQIQVAEVEVQASRATSLMGDLKRVVPEVELQMGPLLKAQAPMLKADVLEMENALQERCNAVALGDYTLWAVGPEAALDMLRAADEAFDVEREKAKEADALAQVFRISGDLVKSRLLISQVEDLFGSFTLMWQEARTCSEMIELSKAIKWKDLIPEGFEDTAIKLMSMVKKLPKTLHETDAYKGLSALVKNFMSACPLVGSLKRSKLSHRHWQELLTASAADAPDFPGHNVEDSLRLEDLMNLDLVAMASDVEAIADKATKEAHQETSLLQLEATWDRVEFCVTNNSSEMDTPLVKISEEHLETLESDMLVVQSMVASRYTYFKKETLEWQRSLSFVSDVMTMLNGIQQMWRYLEPLFIQSDEVKKELPLDTKRFEKIDGEVKATLAELWKVKKVKAACNKPGLVPKLEIIVTELEKCKKSLSEYLSGKKRVFPRFHFTSEADLLDILSNGNQPAKIMPHIDKIMLSTKTLALETVPGGVSDRPRAVHFEAGVGDEIIDFEPAVFLEGKVEIYLQDVLDSQRKTLGNTLKRSIGRYPNQARVEWLMDADPPGSAKKSDPAQVALLVAGINYVLEVEATLERVDSGDMSALNGYHDLQVNQLNQLIELTRSDLKRDDRQRIMSLITMDAHARDIVLMLIREGVTDKADFQWASQLKQRLRGDSGHSSDPKLPMATIDILDSSFEYGFEFLGNGPRLVITPLTDRIYVTATQALHLKMGCAPAGPAGTGKTETTKDLAAALGKCCYVFNCSPEMDYQSLGDIFKGLASSGAWGCFDEFNRLVPEVLSVCSLQFKAVTDGLKAHAVAMAGSDGKGGKRSPASIVIEEDRVCLDPGCGVFITMNPGYLGRSELPEGLKVLFRPITVMVPDLVLICENMLMAEGFVQAKTLASKFYGLYSLLQELLSKQDHYDWGMRAVKSVLVVAGMLKRAEPSLPEDSLLMRALRDFNTPKIVHSDEAVFFGLLDDLFPSVNPPRLVNDSLNACVREVCEDMNLWPDEAFVLKVSQLDELLAIRHCNFIVGQAGAGKSSCWKVLKEARSRMDPRNKVKDVDINPKTMATEDLYGHISLATREWKDGLLSTIMRDLGAIPNSAPKWIVLDGDLDANWIESMNSVMDDNRVLTLASNERIPLRAHMRMIFEIRDLKYATPATVSRAGILYISTVEGQQWHSLIASWVTASGYGETVKSQLSDLFDSYIPKVVQLLVTQMKTSVECEPTTAVSALLQLLEGFLKNNTLSDASMVEHSFVFCAIWAFGSSLGVGDDGIDYRKAFSDWWRREFNKAVKLPARDTIFDYFLDLSLESGECRFEPWTKHKIFKVVDFDSNTMQMNEVTVPTAETASATFWMEQRMGMGKPVMLVGPAGTGKTQLVMGALRNLMAKRESSYLTSKINMNFYTSASVLQSSMTSSLQKKSGSSYGPPGSANMVFFVDDLNLPAHDAYNTQSAIALIRQHMDYGHWYTTTKLTVQNISDCQYVAAMNPTAGSFQINPRLQRHFLVFAIGMPSPTSLLAIFETFLEGHLRQEKHGKRFQAGVVQVCASVIKGALSVHHEVSDSFRKTAANFHYEFNMRHLTNVFEGLLKAYPKNFVSGEQLVHLWLHESERVYGDRLVNRHDIDRFRSIMASQAKKAFPQYNCQRFFMDPSSAGNGGAGQPLIFNFCAEGEYVQVESTDILRETLEAALMEYNAANAVMDLVLFDEACLHVARVSRVLQQAGGHAMLIGVGGSGKQSLAKLAVYMAGLTPVSIVISKSYSLNDFKADLQVMFTKAGVKGQGVGFLFTDSQIVQERFLVYLNDLLSSGNIPDLYTKDEQLSISESLVEVVKAKGISPEPSACWDYFVQQVREKLHVILCFSPMAPEFRNRARKFPALVSCTVIDWFQPWPKEALASVGTRFLAKSCYLDGEGIRAGVEQFMMKSFEGVNAMCTKFLAAEGRYVYTTPKSYLELLKLFIALLETKHVEADAAIQRLEGGVLKLAESAEAVANLEDNLKVMLASAEEKRAQSDKMADQVRTEREGVERETENANIEADKVAIIQNEVSRKQADAETDLAKAEPAVLAAMSALDTLDKSQLGQCKTMSVPPPGVVDIFIACMVLLATLSDNVLVSKQTGKVRDKDRTWDSVKKSLLGNINGFLEELKEFKGAVDDGSVPEVNIREVRPFLDLEHFKVEVIEKRNSAAAGLCSWVLNIVQYYDIVRTVEPKRRALQEANDQLAKANLELGEVRSRLAQLEETLAILNAEYEKADGEKQEAQATYERGKTKIELARRLVSSLGGETERWATGVKTLSEEKENLVGDVLVASAFLSYVGPFTKPFREQLVKEQWLPLMAKSVNNGPMPMSPGADPLGILSDDAEILKWNTQGLPADPVSAENGAIVDNCARWPLIIDPQLQGIIWLKQKEASRNLQIVRLGQKDLLRKLQQAMERGFAVIVENMGETIDPVVLPVVTRAFVRRGNRNIILLGDDEVEQHPDFRLFLHTKLSNPHFPPEIQAETTVVNFMVTPVGLEDQLLSVVIKTERPDLAAHKSALLQQQNQFKIRIRELEDDILVRLTESSGDVTEDRALVEGLEESKTLSKEITQKLAEMKLATEKINSLSEEYRDVARRGSLLCFFIADLHKINSLYVYSLNAFVAIFQCGIDLVNEEAGRRTRGSPTREERKPRKKQRQSTVQPFGWNENIMRPSTELSEEVVQKSIGGVDDFLRIEGDESTAAQDVLLAKIPRLQARITLVVFNYIRRGLVEKDKLIVASVMALRILRHEDKNGGQKTVEAFVSPRPAGDSAIYPEEARRILPEHTWKSFLGLELLGEDDAMFQEIGAKFVMFAEEWADWYQSPCPEEEGLPGDFVTAGEMQTLCIVRVLRPDRITFALRKFVAGFLGEDFVSQPPFSMRSVYEDSSASTPILFLLFPGVDPSAWVEDLGREMGITTASEMLSNTSMGQGQESKAERTIGKLARKGGWVMLQNVHLMQSWLPTLVVTLEGLSGRVDPSFRCFLSAEPPPLPTMQNMPEALLQSCLKVANEAPADLRSNLQRSWAMFDQEKLDSCTAAKEFRACLFALCFFHSLVLGRRRFGQLGWSRSYGFTSGDLSICANILQSYWEASGSVSGRGAPWQELRYIFGEIMYGGHITDYFDRRVTTAYLEEIFDEGLLAGKALAPGFLSPEPEGMDHHMYTMHIERSLPDETPGMFGMPANAEVGYLTTAAEEIFTAFLRLETAVDAERSPRGQQEEDDASAAAAGGGNAVGYTTADSIRQSLLPSLPSRFDMNAIQGQAKGLLDTEQGPYVVIAVQECSRMNVLILEMKRSLLELVKGMDGQLNKTQAMEDLQQALAKNEVPGRDPYSTSSWERYAWPSRKNLSSWFADLVERVGLFRRWTATLKALPSPLWLTGLFNATAFLTALKQVSSRKLCLPLDKITVETRVTCMETSEEAAAVGSLPSQGALVHGFFVEGARWNFSGQAEEDEDEMEDVATRLRLIAERKGGEESVEDVMRSEGHLADARPKDVISWLPIVYVKAVPVEDEWTPTSVGYMRGDKGNYDCPVYLTSNRGPHFVFLAGLRTVDPARKWVVAGVALVMQTDL